MDVVDVLVLPRTREDAEEARHELAESMGWCTVLWTLGVARNFSPEMVSGRPAARVVDVEGAPMILCAAKDGYGTLEGATKWMVGGLASSQSSRLDGGARTAARRLGGMNSEGREGRGARVAGV